MVEVVVDVGLLLFNILYLTEESSVKYKILNNTVNNTNKHKEQHELRITQHNKPIAS